MKVALTELLLPSVTVTLLMASVGVGSLSVIVPVPDAVAIVAFAGVLRVTVNVSVASSRRSPRTATLIGWVVTPGAKVSVLVAAVKSLPDVAVPPAVA